MLKSGHVHKVVVKAAYNAPPRFIPVGLELVTLQRAREVLSRRRERPRLPISFSRGCSSYICDDPALVVRASVTANLRNRCCHGSRHQPVMYKAGLQGGLLPDRRQGNLTLSLRLV